MNPTDEQLHILSQAKTTSSNLMIRALAGTGKTSTLELIERAIPTKPILYLVFNKKNAEEAEKRLLSTTTVRTFNSIGHRIWSQSTGKRLAIDTSKVRNLMRGIIDSAPKSAQPALWEVNWDVINGVNLAKSLGYIPDGIHQHVNRIISRSAFHASLDEEPDDLVADLIDTVLTQSITAAYAGSCDFNDQIYMPAMFGGIYPRFPVVLVDEYQDLNPVNHLMIDRLAKQRLMGVGDQNQSIYAFRGAKLDGMDSAVAKFKMNECDLSISFRCPSEIVKHVHWRVPHFRWLNEGGSVDIAERLDPRTIPDNSAIICRNNAPLFSTALRLLSSGRSVSVAGSDIGPKLLAILKRLGPDNLPRPAVISAIDDWQAQREAKNSASASDMAECLRVFAGFGADLGQAIRYAEHLFAQKGTLRLLTGHKSKGLEFDNVYHLNPWLCKDDDQDQNLRYVISTRSKDRLTEINSDQIEW